MKRLVYLISPSKIYPKFYIDLNKVLASKRVSFFQLRLKNMTPREVTKIARKLKNITQKYNVKLIINDNSLIAKRVNADGCHLGQNDDTIELARKNIKKKIIGLTCHGSKKLALKALKNKCDYVAFGSFFKSKLKPKAKKTNLKILNWAKKNIKIPIIVIGGITDKNYKKLINSGANYIAISTFIWNNPFLKPEIAIKKFI
ncbi:thiamine phosphate synthase [Pelagibacteraceae bacterium]|nr:thiamine phosphate synthase [Pelagibacteraceae bacterium]